MMGETTQKRLELSTSAVTGRRSNQLSHWALLGALGVRLLDAYAQYMPPLLASALQELGSRHKWTFGDSNPGPTGYEPVALTN